MSGSTKEPKEESFMEVLPALAQRGRGSESFRVGQKKGPAWRTCDKADIKKTTIQHLMYELPQIVRTAQKTPLW